ncbi:AAC-rich mRNA clone AAC11 protein [Aplysia californica]|uniref:AAC-rich mRNA clone AAC11 protein n=1 Tax=Aplysia californica TaxID=6500 RepID=A0ABM0ZXU4_APLCA|nr:AAC-rich mRNA clone AAC11 protein [Aplysia californica]
MPLTAPVLVSELGGTRPKPNGQVIVTRKFLISGTLPGLPERLSPPQLPYDSQILRFRASPTPDSIRERLLACMSGQLRTSSTPTATFPGSELLYGGGSDGLHRPSHGSDDMSAPDLSGYERDRQRLRDLEIGNKRPTSRSKRPSYATVEKTGSDREESRPVHNSLPAKTPALRNTGIRSSLVRGEQLLSQRNSGAREPEDLIAMGTLWSPANNTITTTNNNNNNNSGASSSGPTRSSSNTTASNKSLSGNNNGSSSSNNNNNNGGGGVCGSQRKPISVAMSSGRLGHSSSFNGLSNLAAGRTQQRDKDVKEVEPKYPDPLVGAPASFQQRLMELGALEAETIRWERIKKVKKKPKQDRDS